MFAANLIERQGTPIGRSRAGAVVRFLKMCGEIAHVDEVGGGGDGSAGNYIFDLANVTGPIVLQHNDLSATGESPEPLSVG